MTCTMTMTALPMPGEAESTHAGRELAAARDGSRQRRWRGGRCDSHRLTSAAFKVAGRLESGIVVEFG